MRLRPLQRPQDLLGPLLPEGHVVGVGLQQWVVEGGVARLLLEDQGVERHELLEAGAQALAIQVNQVPVRESVQQQQQQQRQVTTRAHACDESAAAAAAAAAGCEHARDKTAAAAAAAGCGHARDESAAAAAGDFTSK